MREIPLTRGLVALVDDEDAEWLGQWRWRVNQRRRNLFYAVTTIDGREAKMHRLLLRPQQGLFVDHIDGNGLNNRRSNLRIASCAQNLWNAGKSARNTTGFKGVSRKKEKYSAKIRVARKLYHLGTFDTPQDAHAAYCAAARKHFGEFARFE